MKSFAEIVAELDDREAAGGIPQRVYLMTSRSFGACKIGISSNPRSRLRQIRAHRDLPDIRLRVSLAPPGGVQAIQVELVAHTLLRKRLYLGEWYKVKPRTALMALVLADGAWRFANVDAAVGVFSRRLLCAGRQHRFADLETEVARMHTQCS